MADVAEGEDDDDDEGEEGLADLIASREEAEAAEKGARGTARHRALHNELTGGLGGDVDEARLEAYLKERYGAHLDDDDDEDFDADAGAGGMSEIEQQGLVPSVKDPKLWMVQCRPTHEREAALQLMAKYVAIATGRAAGEKMLITSALAVDGLSAVIYVEAHKESHVREACMNIRNIYTRKIRMVPLREMVTVMQASKGAKANVTDGCYARLRGGAYKGDLAQVIQVQGAQGQAWVRVVPRIDYNRIAAKNKGRTQEVKAKGRARPEARLFYPKEAQERTHEMANESSFMVDGKPCYEWHGLRFRHGLLLKHVSLKTLVLERNPQFDELERFRVADEAGKAADRAAGIDEDEDGDGDAAKARSTAAMTTERREVDFHKGDSVEVIEGDLVGLFGEIVFVDTKTKMATIKPKDEDIVDNQELPVSQLRKHYAVGEHVKVTAGVHEGVTGMITRVDQEQGVAYIFSDMGQDEIKCFVDDLTSVSSAATGQAATDGGSAYQVHDLVQLDATTWGVVVSAQRDSLRVLTSAGSYDEPDVRSVRVATVQRKIFSGRNMSVQDKFMNDIKVKDMVEITEGPGASKKVSVEHVYRGSIFGRCREYPLYGGRVHLPARSVVVLGGRRTTGAVAGMGMGGGMAASGPVMGPGGVAYGSQTPARLPMQSPAHTPAALGGAPQTAMGSYGAPAMGSYGAASAGMGGTAMDNSRLLEGKRLKVKKGPWKGYRGRIKKVTTTHYRVEFEATTKLAMVKRGDCSVEGMVDMPESAFGAMGGDTYGDARDQFGRTPAHPGMTPARDALGGQTPLHAPGSRTPAHGAAWSAHAALTPAHEPSGYTSYGTTAPTPGGGGEMGATPGSGNYASTPYLPGQTPAAATPYGADGASAPTPGGYNAAPTPGGYNAAPTPGGYNAAPTPDGGGYGAATPGTPGYLGAPTPGGAIPGPPGPPPAPPALTFPLRAGVLVKLPGQAQELAVVDPGAGGSGLVSLQPTDGSGAPQSVPRAQALLVAPGKNDAVVVLYSEEPEHIGCNGSMIGVDGTDAIVKLDGGEDIVIVELGHLGKVIAR